jgi:hypothetical protein
MSTTKKKGSPAAQYGFQPASPTARENANHSAHAVRLYGQEFHLSCYALPRALCGRLGATYALKLRVPGVPATEKTMKPKSLFIVACFATALLMSTSPSALAAKSPAMQACSAQWADMKKAGKTEGQTWPKFWSQCSKDYAAKNEGGATEPEKTTKSSKKATTAAVDESDSTGSGQQKKDCDAKWGSYKAKSGAHGWHDYFQFMAKCM